MLHPSFHVSDESLSQTSLKPRQLSSWLNPLGHLSGKDETRRLAREFGLALASKPDSQEICFVPKEGYISFLQEKAPAAVRPGVIVDTSGKRVGDHPGVAFYTIGQRKRLPSSNTGAKFVVSLDAETNTIVVGSNEDLYADGLVADTCVWLAMPGIASEQSPLDVTAKIRYNGSAVPARIVPGDGPDEVKARFDAPQRAVTPGQSAVFYGGAGVDATQVVLGGGIIREAIRER
jgi:tRNA-specific 2-thiouridylase